MFVCDALYKTPLGYFFRDSVGETAEEAEGKRHRPRCRRRR